MLLQRVGRTAICEDCWSAVKPWKGTACACCGIPLVSEALADTADLRCGLCRRNTYDFDLARSYGLYSRPLRDLILHLKFHRRERWGLRLGELLASTWRSIAPHLDEDSPLLIPVPLHYSREGERGFNQAETLARGLKRKLKNAGASSLPRLEARCLARARATPPQSGLRHHARMENVRGAFAVSDPKRVRGRCIILIDDVMTTGATVSACARTLKRAGARKVMVLTLARVTPQFPEGLHPLEPLVDGEPSARR